MDRALANGIVSWLHKILFANKTTIFHLQFFFVFQFEIASKVEKLATVFYPFIIKTLHAVCTFIKCTTSPGEGENLLSSSFSFLIVIRFFSVQKTPLWRWGQQILLKINN